MHHFKAIWMLILQYVMIYRPRIPRCVKPPKHRVALILRNPGTVIRTLPPIATAHLSCARRFICHSSLPRHSSSARAKYCLDLTILDVRWPLPQKQILFTIISTLSNQSGYEPLNLENGSFVNSDNFDATDWGFNPKLKLKFTGIVEK